jgi:deoxyribonuclease V
VPAIPDAVDVDELKDHQRELAREVRIEDELGEVERVAGFDVAYAGQTAFGALVLADVDEPREPVETLHARTKIDMPYVPGLLAFRELPVLRNLWHRLETDVDALIVDGGGLIHPRRLGSASHAGVELEVPAIGVTKSLLLGDVVGEIEEPGDTAEILHEGELIGYAYHSCTRANAKHPIYVSPGHRVTADRALEIVQDLCTGRCKLPEPVQAADRAAADLKAHHRDRREETA